MEIFYLTKKRNISTFLRFRYSKLRTCSHDLHNRHSSMQVPLSYTQQKEKREKNKGERRVLISFSNDPKFIENAKQGETISINLWKKSMTSMVLAFIIRTGNSRISTLPSKSSTRKKSRFWERMCFNSAIFTSRSLEQSWLNFSTWMASSICTTKELEYRSKVFRHSKSIYCYIGMT